MPVKQKSTYPDNWDIEPTGCAENPDYWIFLGKQAAMAV